ncbi:MAG: hypothetical protein K2R98_22890 [Gemmataceae bacterium]|nr:hypothetical protein [Gemmataceae bacterium]
MSHELFYTSAPKGLQPGTRGFCTVASTAGMPAPLVEKIESLSGYRPLFPPLDAKAALNPVVHSHLRIALGSKTYTVLSRICPAGLDYSERTNKFAHHVILESHELPAGGPGWLLRLPGFMETQWDGQVRTLPSGRTPPQGDAPPGVCKAWQKLTGDAGWAGVLAEAADRDSNQQAFLLFEPGMDLLPLLAEALQLLPSEKRWQVTFSTYSTSLPQGLPCNWRGLPRSSPEAANVRRLPGALVIDLADCRQRAAGGPLVDLARTGRASERVAVPRVPASAVVEVPPPIPTSMPQRMPAGVEGAKAPPVPVSLAPPPLPPLPVSGKSPSPAALLLGSQPAVRSGFSGKSFLAGTGSGVLATAITLGALFYLNPSVLGLPDAGSPTPAPATITAEEAKAAAVQEYTSKHEKELHQQAIDTYVKRHEDRVRSEAARTYLGDAKNAEAIKKEAVAAYARDHVPAVQTAAAREYLEKNDKDFAEKGKHYKDVLDLAARELWARNKAEVIDAAVKDYLNKKENREEAKRNAVVELQRDRTIRQEALAEYIDKHRMEVKDAATAKYTKDHEKEVRALAVLQYAKDHPEPVKKPGPPFRVVNKQLDLPDTSHKAPVVLLDIESAFPQRAAGLQLRLIGLPFSIFSGDGREHKVESKFDQMNEILLIKLVAQDGSSSFDSAPKIATIQIKRVEKSEKLIFTWGESKDDDSKAKMLKIAELLRNRVLELSANDKTSYDIAFRKAEPVGTENHPLIKNIADGLSSSWRSARPQNSMFITEKRGNKGQDSFTTLLGAVDAELVPAGEGKFKLKINSPISLYMKVADRHVEVLRADPSISK